MKILSKAKYFGLERNMLSARGSRFARIGYAHGHKRPYNPDTCPDGDVSFANAENFLMHTDMINYLNANAAFHERDCTYHEGFTGTQELRQAMATFSTEHFQPKKVIDAEEVTFCDGATALIELVANVLCDSANRDTIMLGAPVYGAFGKDLAMRTGVELEYVHFGNTDQFEPTCIPYFEAAYERARLRGNQVRALLICNPQNPLGRCYSREALQALVKFCGNKNIHLVSDEIYASSVYLRDDRVVETFSSVFSVLDIDDADLTRRVHILYGLAKDFAASGLRLGCLISRNLVLHDAVRAQCRYSSPSNFSMSMAVSVLSNHDFLETFFAKSRSLLSKHRRLAESLLADLKLPIPIYNRGNAGFFIWLDLSAYIIPFKGETDGWSSHRRIRAQFREAGVIMGDGEAYHADQPGFFRLIFTVEELFLIEGVKRIRKVLESLPKKEQ